MNCYADAHIDVLMSARGFTPKIINRRQADELIAQGKESDIAKVSVTIFRKKLLGWATRHHECTMRVKTRRVVG